MTTEQLEEFIQHQLTFRFRGLPGERTWAVSRETADAFRTVLQKEKRYSAFFVFEDKAEMTVAVNLEHVQYCHVLWEELGEVRERQLGVRIQLVGSEELLVLEPSYEPDEFYLSELLSYCRPGKREFVTWLDVDGEQAFLNSREVVFVEFASDLESPVEEVDPDPAHVPRE